MRLKEIQKILSQIGFNDVGLKYNPRTNVISNINSFKWFLNVIGPISIYDDEITKLHESEIYQTAQDELSVNDEVARKLYRISNYLVNSGSSLVLVFNKLLPDSNAESINIKLPTPSDFEAIIKAMSTIQKSLSQVVVHKDIDGSVRINNWEHGSFWVELILGTQAAVAVVSSIAWAAAVVCKKYNENKILEKTIRAMDIKNESLEDILKSQKEMTQILIKAETDQVIDRHYTDRDPEHIKRVESSIKTFAKLIQDGAEVHPALQAPEEVQNLFPNYNKLESITSQIKRLEQIPEGENDDDGYKGDGV